MEGGRSTSSGLFWAVLSSYFFSLSSLLGKTLELPAAQLVWFGSLGTVFISAPIALQQERLFPKCLKMFVVRSMAGCLFLTMSFYSVRLMPLGDASVLFYTAPVFSLVLAKIYLNEPLTIVSVAFVAVLMCGVVLVTRPPFLFSNHQIDAKYVLGASTALLAALSESVSNVILKELNSKFHFSVIMFNQGVLSMIFTTFTMAYTGWKTPQYPDLYLICLMTIATSVEQILMAIALSRSNLGPVALVQASDIIFGYLYQIWIFGENVEMVSILGAVIIALMVFYIAKETSKRSFHLITV